MADAALSFQETVREKTLGEGPEPLEELSKFFDAAGYARFWHLDSVQNRAYHVA